MTIEQSLLTWTSALLSLLFLFKVAENYLEGQRMERRRQFDQQTRQMWARVLSTQQLAEALTPAWAQVLGLTLPTTKNQVRRAYRTLSKTHHPDRGGSHTSMQQLNEALEQALEALSSSGVSSYRSQE